MRKKPSALPRGADGRWRLAAVAAVFLYAGAAYVSLLGTNALYGALTAYWGVSARSIAYAPGWMRALLGSWGALAAAAQGLVCLLAVALFAKIPAARPLQWRAGHILSGAGIGCLCALLAFAILRATDSVRVAPTAGTSLPFELAALAAAVCSPLASEALLGHLLWPAARKRLGRWLCLALFTIVNAAVYFIPQAKGTLPAAACALAQGAVCAALYEKRSWLGAASWRAAWHFTAYRVLGFSATGAGGMFFETFPVSRDWLTGGDSGLEAGGMALALFLGAAALILLVLKKREADETEERSA